MLRHLRLLKSVILPSQVKTVRLSSITTVKDSDEKFSDNNSQKNKYLSQTNLTHLMQSSAPDGVSLQWDRCVDIFSKHSFTMNDIVQMVSKNPQLLESCRNMEDILLRWFSCKLPTDFIKSLLVERPELLKVSINSVNDRVPFLISLAHTSKNFVILLANCPNVMFDNWQETLRKVEYLQKEMRIPNAEIVKSLALTKSLVHIKTRHNFLVRSGAFKNTPLHKEIDRYGHQNPPLKKIVDSEDISFAKRVAYVTHEEYEVFQELYEDELAEEDDLELNSDLDSDSE